MLVIVRASVSSDAATQTSPNAARSGIALVAAVTGLVALAVLLPDLGDHGIWTKEELPILDRARAALGAAASGLARSPWLPDALRTWTYDAVGGAAGLRLPHALATSALVAMAAAVARWRGLSMPAAALAGALALAFPILGVTGRTALGNPVAELCIATAVIAGLAAMETARLRRAMALALVAATASSLAVLSAGLALGLAMPLTVLAVVAVARHPAADTLTTAVLAPRWLRWALVAAAIGAGGAAVWLSYGQADGYIPILGAAKDLELIDKPELRRFAAGFEDFGYHLFPWTPLVLVGVVAGDRDRLGAVWLAVAVATAAAWSVVYGTLATPVTIPAALCGAAAVERLVSPQTPAVWRRIVLVATIGGILVIGKDAELSPERILAPLSDYPGGHNFPEAKLEATERCKQLRSWAALAILLAAFSATRRGRLGAVMARVPDRHRTTVACGIVSVAALASAWTMHRRVLTDYSRLVSPRGVLARYDTWVSEGALPDRLGAYRVRDKGMTLYGPGDVEALSSRRDASNWLSADEPRAALIRDRDLAALHSSHRHQDWPLYVLDRSHASLVLVANVLPPGAEDLNPIHGVVFDEPQPMAHQTQLRFENYIEIIGWQVTEPVIRTRPASIEVMIKVLRPLPGGCKLFARLIKDRSSRMAITPQPLAGDLYAPNLWREGDYILHRYEFDAPPLEIQWGEHELIIGLRRTESQNIPISIPEGKTGDFGVRVRGSKRSFATVGTVQVY